MTKPDIMSIAAHGSKMVVLHDLYFLESWSVIFQSSRWVDTNSQGLISVTDSRKEEKNAEHYGGGLVWSVVPNTAGCYRDVSEIEQRCH